MAVHNKTDWSEVLVRHDGTDTEFLAREACLVDEHGGNERPLAVLLDNLEFDRLRYQNDRNAAKVKLGQQTADIQKLVDSIKDGLAAGRSWRIDTWDELETEFGVFDEVDTSVPMREVTGSFSLSGTVEFTIKVPKNWDEDAIKEFVGDNLDLDHVDSLSFIVDNDSELGDDPDESLTLELDGEIEFG
ncbi:MAG: hypothetical protein ACO3O3_12365 [Ilumatobacteraceae bacterium]